jgi:hypothetical protein
VTRLWGCKTEESWFDSRQKARFFCLFQTVWTTSEAHPGSYLKQRAGLEGKTLTSTLHRCQELVEQYLHFPICLHGVYMDKFALKFYRLHTLFFSAYNANRDTINVQKFSYLLVMRFQIAVFRLWKFVVFRMEASISILNMRAVYFSHITDSTCVTTRCYNPEGHNMNVTYGCNSTKISFYDH